MLHIGFFWMYRYRLQLEGEGIGRFCVRLAEGLLRQAGDVKITVLTNPDNGDDLARLFSTIRNDFPERLQVLAANNLQWVNDNIDVNIWIVPYVGLLWAQYLAKPYVVCIHDLYYIHFPKEQDSDVAILDNSVKQLTARAAGAVFNSNYMRLIDGVSYLRLPEVKTHTIPLGPPIEEYAAFGLRDEESFRNEYVLHNDYIVFPSAIRHYKNHYRLIAAYINFRQTEEGKNSNISLVLTDNLERYDRPKAIRELALRCDAETRRNVYFVGRMPAQDVPSLYRYSIGTIVPTLFEGSCPFPILESLMMERPVAFSRLEVVREVISDWDEFITFDPYSEGDIQKAIAQLCCADQSLIIRQRAAARAALARSWKDVAIDYYALLMQLA